MANRPRITDQFDPEQIYQIIEEYLSVVGRRQYIGARYVPIFGRVGEDSIEWDNTAPYEPLTIVLYQGNSFTSRQYVPTGIDINNQEFWANTGNYNAQVEAYRREVLAYKYDVDAMASKLERKPYVFETVADMASFDGLKDGDTCITNGFYTAGDGGAGKYIVSAIGEPNGMDLIACGDLVARLDAIEISPKMLGAKGDGTSDDSAYIAHALKRYERVYGDGGKYAVNVTLTAQELAKTTIIDGLEFVSLANDAYCLNLNTARETYAYTNLQIKNVHATCENGLFLLLSGTASQATGQYPIVLDNISVRAGNVEVLTEAQIKILDLSNVMCNGITIKGHSDNTTVGYGMRVSGGINNNYSNIYIDHQGTGLYVYSHDSANTEGINFTNVVVLNCDNDLHCHSYGTTSLLEIDFVNCVFDISPLAVTMYNVIAVKFIGCYFGVIASSENDVTCVRLQSNMRGCMFDSCTFQGNNNNTIGIENLTNYTVDSDNQYLIYSCSFINIREAFGGAGFIQKMTLSNLMFRNTVPYHIGGTAVMIGCVSNVARVVQNATLIGCIGITNS